MTPADRDVFLSYRHREPTATWVRNVLKPALEQAGYSALLDTKDFVPGQILIDEIVRSSARARVTVATVDEWYGQSWYTEYEAAISGILVVVQRGDVEHLPAADHLIDLRNDDDPTKVIEAVDRMIKRAFVLESEADREFVTGYLIPALRQANVDAKDVASLSGAVDSGEPAFKALQNTIDWADRVIVVVSRAYLNDLAHEAGRYLDEFEKTARSASLSRWCSTIRATRRIRSRSHSSTTYRFGLTCSTVSSGTSHCRRSVAHSTLPLRDSAVPQRVLTPACGRTAETSATPSSAGIAKSSSSWNNCDADG